MRWAWLATALLVAGCFEETPSASGCVDGEAACDCKTDGTCNADLECIASIEKCVPIGCTPGSESCTCVDDTCLGELVCSEGVCMTPDAATTGGGASMSGSISDSVADTGPSTTAGATDPSDPSVTDPSVTDPSDPTIPPDTDTIDPTDLTTSMTTDVTASDPTVMTDASASDSFGGLCPDCIATAGMNMCSAEYDACVQNVGCQEVYQCILNLGGVIDCCPLGNDGAANLWNDLVDCAQLHECAGNCHQNCL
jgi:hypothetical protein